MQWSHSRVECFESCKFKYKLRYIDKLKTLPADEPDNALILGTALHTGIEKDIETAIHDYYFSFPVITDAHVMEAMKLEMQIRKAREILNERLPDAWMEYRIANPNFIGFIDMLVPTGGFSEFDLYDFKYSNNIDHYKDSRQLHLYKHYFESQLHGCTIRNMYFVMVPKNNSKQKQDEPLPDFRRRVLAELDRDQPYLYRIRYDPEKVIEHLELTQAIQSETEFDKNETYLCRWCEYRDYCKKGMNYMILPTTERRNINQAQKHKIWIYGPAFSGKTTMLDGAPDPLNLNTDGNVMFVTMPYITMKDEVTQEGRIVKRKLAWEVFQDTITELEKGDNEFKTIIIDLLEDMYEACRIYVYEKQNIQHESDAGYGKGWDIVKTEFLSTIRRFFTLDYDNLIVVSHELSKDTTKKSGQNVTRVAPNLREVIANKIAGMVDIVARVVVEDDETRTLNFKSNEMIFGGGRLKGINQTTVPLSWDALMDVYAEANENSFPVNAPEPAEEQPKTRRSRKPKDEEPAPEADDQDEEPALTRDSYFYLPDDDNYVMVHAGDHAPAGGKKITKKEFTEGCKRLSQEAAPAAEPGKRTRRSRKDEG